MQFVEQETYLLDWIPLEKLYWAGLAQNPKAIHLLASNFDKIPKDYEFFLSLNPNAVPILDANPQLINWNHISSNSNAMHIIESNLDKINWEYLSDNPSASHLFEGNIDKIDKSVMCRNPSAIKIIEKLEQDLSLIHI